MLSARAGGELYDRVHGQFSERDASLLTKVGLIQTAAAAGSLRVRAPGSTCCAPWPTATARTLCTATSSRVRSCRLGPALITVRAENFVFESKAVDSNMKLIDFGCAVQARDDEVIRDVAGSPYYVAPEVLRDVQRTGKVRAVARKARARRAGASDERVAARMHADVEGV